MSNRYVSAMYTIGAITSAGVDAADMITRLAAVWRRSVSNPSPLASIRWRLPGKRVRWVMLTEHRFRMARRLRDALEALPDHQMRAVASVLVADPLHGSTRAACHMSARSPQEPNRDRRHTAMEERSRP